MQLINVARCYVVGISAVVKVKMELTVVAKAVKKVKMISNSNGHKDVVSIVVGGVVSMILVAVSIVDRVKRVATLAKVVMESLKVVARKIVTEVKIAMVQDVTSVATSVEVVEEVVVAAVAAVEVAAAAEAVEDVHVVVKMAVKVDPRKMDKMGVVKEAQHDVVIHVSVVQCVGSKMAMLMVLRMVVSHCKIQQPKVPLKLLNNYGTFYFMEQKHQKYVSPD